MDDLTRQLLAVPCKYCSSFDVWRNGTWRGVQRYICRRCGRGFTNPARLPRAKFPVAVVGRALDGYLSGMSLRRTAAYIEQDFAVSVSGRSIYDWLTRFVPIAASQAQMYAPATVSRTFVVDELVLRIGGDRWWLHTCVVAKTRFILAAHLSRTRTTRDARVLLKEAGRRAGGRIPRVLLTDGLSTYVQAVEDTYGPDSVHVRPSPFARQDDTALVQTWHRTLAERTRVLRGFQYVGTARLWIQGFVFDYNYIRPHRDLGGKTPAEAAGIDFPFKTWLDIAIGQAYPTRPDTAGANIATTPLAPARIRPARRTRRKSFGPGNRSGSTPMLARP